MSTKDIKRGDFVVFKKDQTGYFSKEAQAQTIVRVEGAYSDNEGFKLKISGLDFQGNPLEEYNLVQASSFVKKTLKDVLANCTDDQINYFLESDHFLFEQLSEICGSGEVFKCTECSEVTSINRSNKMDHNRESCGHCGSGQSLKSAFSLDDRKVFDPAEESKKAA